MMEGGGTPVTSHDRVTLEPSRTDWELGDVVIIGGVSPASAKDGKHGYSSNFEFAVFFSREDQVDE